MAKVSPVSIKYMIHAKLVAEGALEKPDVIGALFGQTEGLLGSDLEMRDLQKEGKIGRIEVDLERQDRRTIGRIRIPTALDQSETTLIAAALETIERVGPSDAQIEIEKIEDVRGSKRDYIIDRAKKLMAEIHGTANSKEISNEIKDSAKTSDIKEFGENKLASGDLTEDEVIVVEGRADVLSLMKAGVKNVIEMNGTKLPSEIKELSKEKKLTLFVDGDRGGKLIAKNVCDNAKIDYIASAPDGKEVEELTGKEILMCLRKKVPVEEFFHEKDKRYQTRRDFGFQQDSSFFELNEDKKSKIKEISKKIKGTEKAVILNSNLEEIKKSGNKIIASSLDRLKEKPVVLIIDGNATKQLIEYSEDAGIKVIVAKNFSTTDTKVKLMSL